MKRPAFSVAIAATTLAVSTFVFAAPAAAKITELKFHVVQTTLDDAPYMEMEHNGKSWVWSSQSKNFNVRTKVKLKSVGNRFWNAAVVVERTGEYLWWMPEHKTFEYEKLEHTTIGKNFLAPFKNDAASLCSVFGGAKKTVRDMEIGLRLWAESSNSGPSVKGIFPVRVVCSSKKEPASASADATPPARVPVALKVNEVRLYTSPAKPVCGKPVRLIAEFHTNKPGKIEFTLHRKDGEKQAASISVDKTPDGYAKRWSKEYSYDTSITREYKIVVKGHPISTEWVPVTVKCGVGKEPKRPGAFAN